MSLRLPRDRQSVTVARHIVRQAVEEIGVEPDCVHDIELSLSEACANVLLHAGRGEQYDVRVEVADERCEIQVIDSGRGFEEARLPKTSPDAERGRGLLLMSALVDRVHFNIRPQQGTTVRMEKSLVYADRSLPGR